MWKWVMAWIYQWGGEEGLVCWWVQHQISVEPDWDVGGEG